MQEHTITGEAVVLNLRAANVMPRLGAALLDAVIYFLGWLLVMILVGQYTTVLAMDIAAAPAVAIISMVTRLFLVSLLVAGLSKGRPVGKFAFGLGGVRDDG